MKILTAFSDFTNNCSYRTVGSLTFSESFPSKNVNDAFISLTGHS